MKKDWTGNSKSTFINIGASSHTEKERECNDYYASDPIAAEWLLKIENLDNNIFEPSVGEGHLAEVFKKAGHKVFCADLIDRGYPDTKVQDFLKYGKQNLKCDIVTNPPYSLAKQFILKSLDTVAEGQKVCMFLKTQFLESVKRRDELFSKYPPVRVWVSSSRIMCAKNGDFEGMKAGGGSAVSYCWYIWEKGNYTNGTQLKWFN